MKAIHNLKLTRTTLTPLVLAVLAFAGTAPAATRTWSGGGADANWSTLLNWNAVPANGDDVVFAGALRTTNLNNIANLRLNSIVFNSSSFQLAGNAITNLNGVVDNAGNNTNNLIMTLGAAQAISNNAAGTFLQFGSAITNNGFNLTVGGDGTVFLSGILGGTTGASTNSGGLTVAGGPSGGGLVRLSGANIFVGGVTVNAGTLRLGNAAAIPTGAGKGDVNLAFGTILDLNANSQTINGLNGSGTVDNQLTTEAATTLRTLTVGNNATNSAGTFSGTIQSSYGMIGLTKVNTNTFTMTGNAFHTGPTLISAGTFALGAGAYLGSTPTITVSPGATLDASAAGFDVGYGQTLTAGRSTNGGPNDILGNLSSSSAINIYRPGSAGTLAISGGLTLNAGTVAFDLGPNTAVGAGTNDLIVINGQLNLSGSTTIQLSPAGGTFAAGTYTLISNATALVSGSAGNLVASVPRGITAVFDITTQPGSLLVNISGTYNPTPLTWSGSNSSDWDVQTSLNWLSGATPSTFYNLDNVLFTDQAATATINIPGGVSPGSTLFNNSVSNYIIAGSGSISGNGGLTKSGIAQLTVRNANTFTGNTTVNAGALIVDFLNSGATLSQLLYNGVTAGSLTLAGGDFQENNRGNATTYQLFTSTTLAPGASRVLQNTRLSGGSPSIYLGPITRNAGGTVDVQANTGSSGTQTANTVGVFTTSTNNSSTAVGILGGYATSGNGAEWARVNTSAGQQGGTHIYGGATYTNMFAANTNTDMTANLSVAANTNTATVRFNTAGARTLTLNGTNVITTGGILVTPTVGANTATITGGSSLTSGNGQDLIVHQFDSTGNLIINSVIANNGVTPIALTKSGVGTVVLGGNNTFTGPTYLNAGTLQIGNGGAAGSIAASSGVTNNGTLAFNRSDAINFNLPITGRGALQVKSGSVTLTSDNAFSGATTITAGALQVGNGGTAGSLGATPNVTDNGTLTFNRSDNVSFSGPISGTGGLVQQGPGRLTLGGTNTYLGSTTINGGTLALTATASISNSPLITVAAGTQLDVSSVTGFSLNGGVVNQVLAGSGTVVGNVATASGIRISPATDGVFGTLTFSNNLTVGNGAFLSLDVSTTNQDLLVVDGNLALNDGTLVLNVVNPLTNGLYRIIHYGTLSGSPANLTVAGFSQPGQIAQPINRAGEIFFVVSSFNAANLVWQGDGINNPWDAGITSDWTNSAGDAALFHQFDNVTFDNTSPNLSVKLVGKLSPSLVTVNAASDYTFQGAGQLAGGTLTKQNSGTLTILTTNSFTGPTVVNAGTLQFGDGSAAGSVASSSISNFAAVVFNAPGDQTVVNAFSGPGSLTQAGVGTLSMMGNSTFSGPTLINSGVLQVGVGSTSGSLGTGPVTNNTALVFNRSGSLTQSGLITGSGSVSNVAAGALTFSGNNSYAGNTVIANGTLKLGANEVIPDGVGMGNVVLDGGASVAGTLDLNGFNETINGLAGATGTVLGQVANNNGSATKTLTVGNADTSSSFLGRILDNTGVGGKVALTKTGAGTLTLQPGGLGSTYSGGTTISNGVISGGNSTTANGSMCGSGPVTFYDNGTLQLAGWTGSTSSDYGTFANAVILAPNANAMVYGTCRGGGFVPSTATGPTNSTLTFLTRYVRGSFGGNWTGFNGLLVVSNNASSSGNDFRLNTALGFPNARVYLAAGGGGGAYVYNLVTGTPIIPIGELTGDASATIALSSGANGGQPALWSVGGLNTSAEYDGGITDTHGIIKVGTGTWTLNSANLPYSGPTTVSNGVLALSATTTLPSSATITLVAPGILDVSASGTLNLGTSTAQTLRGDGTLKGNLLVDLNGTLAPGYTIGTLKVTSAVTLGGTALMELNRTNSPATNDLLVATTITGGGTLQVTNLGPTLYTGDSFKLFSAPVSGFAAVNLPATSANGALTYTWQDNLAVDGSIKLLSGFSAVPTNLSFTVSGGVLELSWPADHIGWTLQAQTNALAVGITTNWSTVAGSTLTNRIFLPVSTTNGTVFFRMVYP